MGKSSISKIDSKKSYGKFEQIEFDLTAPDYAKMYGVDITAAYRDLPVASAKLFERSFKYIDPKGDGRVEVRWLSSVKYNDGRVVLRFSPEVTPFLTALKGSFTSYKLHEIAGLTSQFAIRLYEMLMQWQKTKTLELELDELKERLMVDGKSYDIWHNLRSRVIDVAVEQINEGTGLSVKYEVLKRGKKVVAVKFGFHRKAPEESDSFTLGAEEVPNVNSVEGSINPERFVRTKVYSYIAGNAQKEDLSTTEYEWIQDHGGANSLNKNDSFSFLLSKQAEVMA